MKINPQDLPFMLVHYLERPYYGQPSVLLQPVLEVRSICNLLLRQVSTSRNLSITIL